MCSLFRRLIIILSFDLFDASAPTGTWSLTLSAGSQPFIRLLTFDGPPVGGLNYIYVQIPPSPGFPQLYMAATPLYSPVWNHVEVAVNLASNSYHIGSTAFGSPPWNGSDSVPFPVTMPIDRISFTGNSDSAIYIDNVSVRVVPEPATGCLLAVGSSFLIMRRRQKRPNPEGCLAAKPASNPC